MRISSPCRRVHKVQCSARDVATEAELAFVLASKDRWWTTTGSDGARRLPRFFVIEEVYEEALDGRRRSTPEVYSHVMRTLELEYELMYDRSHYQIFMRRSPEPTPKSANLEP